MADLNKDEFSASKEQKKYRTELEFANNNLKENEEKSKSLRQVISGSGLIEIIFKKLINHYNRKN